MTRYCFALVGVRDEAVTNNSGWRQTILTKVGRHAVHFSFPLFVNGRDQ